MLSVNHGYFGYDQNYLFEDITLQLGDTSFVCISGKSGCGKTTLLKLLVGEQEFTQGNVVYQDEELNQDNYEDFLFNHVSYIDQDGTFFNNMSIYQHFKFYGKLHGLKVDKLKVKEWLKQVNLTDIDIKKSPAVLSTGERKRLIIAVALMTGKGILVLDEPTASLDHENKKILITLLKSLSERMLVICTSHDKMVVEAADHHFVIDNKKLTVQKTPLLDNNEQKVKKERPKRLNYFRFKRLKERFLFSLIMVITGAMLLYLSWTCATSIAIKSQINNQSTANKNILFYKLADIRYSRVQWNYICGPIASDDFDYVKNIPGIKNLVPYYAAFDGVNKSFQYEYPDGRVKECSFFSERMTNEDHVNHDWYMNIALRSYSPQQHIKVDGKEISGVYIDEELASYIGGNLNGGVLKARFNYWPINYHEEFSDYQEPSGAEFKDVKFIKYDTRSIDLSLKISGVIPSNVYYDGDSSEAGNYVNIYLPLEQYQDLIKTYDQGSIDIIETPLAYQIIYDQKDIDDIKVKVEQANESYRVNIPDDFSLVPETGKTSFTVMMVTMILILVIVILICYQSWIRKREVRLLKREGLKKQIVKYFMQDYYLLTLIWIIILVIGLMICKMILGSFYDWQNFTIAWLSISLLMIVVIDVIARLVIGRIVRGEKR